MRTILLLSSTLAGLALAAGPALAQAAGVTYGPNPVSTHASNIAPTDTQSPIAPQLPTTGLGSDATVAQNLGVAHSALAAGKTGLAQEALERAETTALTRSVTYNAGDAADTSPLVSDIRSALQALGSGDLASASHYTDVATQAAGK